MKKSISIILSFILIMAIILPASAFSSIAVKGIKLDKSKITLKVGQTYKLKVTLTPANTTQKLLTYVTGNKKIATIDATGKIKGVSKGTTTITVYTYNKKIFAKCNVTVSQLAASVETKSNVYPENGLPKDQNVTIRVAFWESGNGKEWFETIAGTFMKKFPNVKIEITASPSIGTITKPKIAANDNEDMFDLFSGSGLSMPSLLAAGKCEPIEDLWNRSPYDVQGKTMKDLMYNGIYDTRRVVNGVRYDMPYAVSMTGVFFDQVLFDKNGWNKQPKTWDEFVQLCDTIKKTGLDPIVYSGMYQYLQFMADAKDFEIAEANGNKDYASNYRTYIGPQYYATPENIQRWQKVGELGKKGYFAKGSDVMSHTDSQMVLLQHKAAMCPSGDWIAKEMKDSIPAGFKWGFMMVPFTNNPNATLYDYNLTSDTLYIWAAKSDLVKKWAKELLLWQFTMDSQTTIAEKTGALPSRKDFSEDASRASKLSDIHQSIQSYMKTRNVKLETYSRTVALTDPAYNQAVKYYLEHYNKMAFGQEDPQVILKEVDRILQKAIDAQKK
jgi:ABC-type sugar transport system, periplasmic component